MKTKEEIEKQILEISNSVLMKWNKKFRDISVVVDGISVQRESGRFGYFSEIEFNFWKDNGSTFGTVDTLIIYMQDKLITEPQNAKKKVEKIIKMCYIECVG